MKPSFEALTGRSEGHLCEYNDSVLIHASVKSDFLELQKQCLKQGIELEIASGFRSYERQELIWEEKVQGKRSLYNKEQALVDVSTASEKEILEALLCWSAIPGCSRHHWGTDLDLFDFASFKDGKKLQLIQSEYLASDGPCFRMHQYLISNNNLKFYRPYEKEGQGIQPEPWHYSSVKIAREFENQYSIDTFKKNLESANFTFSKEILKKIDSYFLLYKP